MKKTGRDFEALVSDFYAYLCGHHPDATVKLDDRIPTPDGVRQFDATIRHTIAGMEFLTVIECKDYSSRVNVDKVDALASKMSDVKAAKAILVSPMGFRQGAIQKAKRLGIELCVFGKKENMSRELIDRIPVLIDQIVVDQYWKFEKVGRLLAGTPKVPPTFDSAIPDYINGVSLSDIILDGVHRGKFRPLRAGEEFFELQIHNNFQYVLHLNEYFSNDVQIFELTNGLTEFHQNVTIALRYRREWFCGVASDLDSATHMINITRDNAYSLSMPIEPFKDWTVSLEKYDDFEMVPDYAKNAQVCFRVLDMRLDALTAWQRLASRHTSDTYTSRHKS